MSAARTTNRLARLRDLAFVAMAAAAFVAAAACVIQPQPLPPGEKPTTGDSGAPTGSGSTPPLGPSDAGAGSGDTSFDAASPPRTDAGQASDGGLPGDAGSGSDAGDGDAGDAAPDGPILIPLDGSLFDASGRT